jgi:hypothetical protein
MASPSRTPVPAVPASGGPGSPAYVFGTALREARTAQEWTRTWLTHVAVVQPTDMHTLSTALYALSRVAAAPDDEPWHASSAAVQLFDRIHAAVHTLPPMPSAGGPARHLLSLFASCVHLLRSVPLSESATHPVSVAYLQALAALARALSAYSAWPHGSGFRDLSQLFQASVDIFLHLAQPATGRSLAAGDTAVAVFALIQQCVTRMPQALAAVSARAPGVPLEPDAAFRLTRLAHTLSVVAVHPELHPHLAHGPGALVAQLAAFIAHETTTPALTLSIVDWHQFISTMCRTVPAVASVSLDLTLLQRLPLAAASVGGAAPQTPDQPPSSLLPLIHVRQWLEQVAARIQWPSNSSSNSSSSSASDPAVMSPPRLLRLLQEVGRIWAAPANVMGTLTETMLLSAGGTQAAPQTRALVQRIVSQFDIWAHGMVTASITHQTEVALRRGMPAAQTLSWSTWHAMWSVVHRLMPPVTVTTAAAGGGGGGGDRYAATMLLQFMPFVSAAVAALRSSGASGPAVGSPPAPATLHQELDLLHWLGQVSQTDLLHEAHRFHATRPATVANGASGTTTYRRSAVPVIASSPTVASTTTGKSMANLLWDLPESSTWSAPSQSLYLFASPRTQQYCALVHGLTQRMALFLPHLSVPELTNLWLLFHRYVRYVYRWCAHGRIGVHVCVVRGWVDVWSLVHVCGRAHLCLGCLSVDGSETSQATGILVQFIRVAGAFRSVKFRRRIFATAVASLDAIANRAAIVFTGPSECSGTALIWHAASGNGSVRFTWSVISSRVVLLCVRTSYCSCCCCCCVCFVCVLCRDTMNLVCGWVCFDVCASLCISRLTTVPATVSLEVLSRLMHALSTANFRVEASILIILQAFRRACHLLWQQHVTASTHPHSAAVARDGPWPVLAERLVAMLQHLCLLRAFDLSPSTAALCRRHVAQSLHVLFSLDVARQLHVQSLAPTLMGSSPHGLVLADLLPSDGKIMLLQTFYTLHGLASASGAASSVPPVAHILTDTLDPALTQAWADETQPLVSVLAAGGKSAGPSDWLTAWAITDGRPGALGSDVAGREFAAMCLACPPVFLRGSLQQLRVTTTVHRSQIQQDVTAVLRTMLRHQPSRVMETHVSAVVEAATTTTTTTTIAAAAAVAPVASAIAPALTTSGVSGGTLPASPFMAAVQRVSLAKTTTAVAVPGSTPLPAPTVSTPMPALAPTTPTVSATSPVAWHLEAEFMTEIGYSVDIAILPLRIAIQIEGPSHYYRGGEELRVKPHAHGPSLPVSLVSSSPAAVPVGATAAAIQVEGRDTPSSHPVVVTSGSASANAPLNVQASGGQEEDASSAVLRIDLQPDRTSESERARQRKVTRQLDRMQRHAAVEGVADPTVPSQTKHFVDEEARGENRTLLVSALQRYQHLQDAGWTVLSVPYFTWRAQPTLKEKVRLLGKLHPVLAELERCSAAAPRREGPHHPLVL